jgi:phosphocarrier protein HPr
VGRYRLVDCWSRAEWERRPAWARPQGAVPLGDCWLLLTEEWPDGSRGTRAEPPASGPGGELPNGSHRGGGVMPEDDAVPTVRRPVVIRNALGLHLRPAGRFVDLARRFEAEIRVHRDGLWVDGKSILDLAMLAAGCGTRLELEARGPDAEESLAALADLVAARFHEGDEAGCGSLAADGLGNIKGHSATVHRPSGPPRPLAQNVLLPANPP